MRVRTRLKRLIKDVFEYVAYARMVVLSCGRPDDRPKDPPADVTPRSRILIVELQILAPETNAGDRNVLDFIRTLRADGHQISFWPQISAFKPDDLQRLLDLGVDVIIPGRRAPFVHWARRYRDHFDAIIVCRPYVAERYLPAARMFRAPLLYYGHDLHCVRLEMQARVMGDDTIAAQAAQMEVLERWIMGIADLSLYPSKEEVDHIQANFGIHNVQKILIYSFDKFVRRDIRPVGDQIVFVGGFRHQPNVDAAKRLANDIFPIVRTARKDAKLVIIGAHATEEIFQLESEAVSVRSNIPGDELLRAYQEAAVSLIPLRIGAGVKLKVVEALVQGVPTVTTSVGLQGLGGLDAIIGCHNQVEQLAQAAIDVLALNEARWLELSARCTEYAEAEFGRANMKVSLDSALANGRRFFDR